MFEPLVSGFLLYPRFAARACGFWPETRPSYGRNLHFWLAFSAVTIIGVAMILNGFENWSHLNAVIEDICPGITCLVTAIKMSLMFFNQKQWQHMLQKMHLMQTQDTNEEKIKISEKFNKKAGMLSFILITMANATNTTFAFRPLIQSIYNKLEGHQVINELPFPVLLPGIFVKYPLYPLTYALLAFGGLMTCMTFSAVDGLFICICMHFSSMFCMLRHDIKCAFYDNLESGTCINQQIQKCDDFSMAVKNIRLRVKLADIVLRHNKIIACCTEFVQKFTFIIIMNFLLAPLIICTSILNLMLNSSNIGLEFFLYIFYSITALMQLLLYCIGGSVVQQNSVALASTLYGIEWYKCDVQTRKMILMMLQHTQRAQTIAVPFFTLTLSAFTSIISTTGSYFTLLNSFL